MSITFNATRTSPNLNQRAGNNKMGFGAVFVPMVSEYNSPISHQLTETEEESFQHIVGEKIFKDSTTLHSLLHVWHDPKGIIGKTYPQHKFGSLFKTFNISDEEAQKRLKKAGFEDVQIIPDEQFINKFQSPDKSEVKGFNPWDPCIATNYSKEGMEFTRKYQ